MSEAAVQQFPTGKTFPKQLNLTLSQLFERIGRPREAAYSYILKSVGWDSTGRLAQYGSGPNFQGGCLTLCTCKHQMRSSLEVSDWPDIWLAGFTSRSIRTKRHWLFFLTRIARAYESHSELWHKLPTAVRIAKSAQTNYLGDLFAPQGKRKLAGVERFDPRNYVSPPRHSHHMHSCDTGWHKDIRYKRFGRRPSLLIGDPKFTFIWNEPLIRLDGNHCRDFKKWGNASELLAHLRRNVP